MKTADAAKYFFQGALSIWLGAPEFNGSPVNRSLNEWFDISLRENFSAIERKRGAAAYIGLLRSKVEEAYQNYERGSKEAGVESMLELLDLIHIHLKLPSQKQIAELVKENEESKRDAVNGYDTVAG